MKYFFPIALIVSATCLGHASAAPGNWLFDGGFEKMAEPRELGLPSGADRRDFASAFGWRFDEDQVIEGKRALVITGPRPFTWRLQRAFPKKTEGVFSVYLRSNREGVEVEAGVEISPTDDHDSVRPRAFEEKTFRVGTQWQRVVIPFAVEEKTASMYMHEHLIKAWIKPVDDDEVWIDAAQLEVGRSKPSPFKDKAAVLLPPSEPLNGGVGKVMEETVPTPPPPANLPAGAIDFTVRETALLSRQDGIASGGIPVGSGQIFDTTALWVTDSEGKPVEAQTRILARRPHDGSAISVLVTIPASLSATELKAYRLNYGRGARPASTKQLAKQTGGDIVLSTLSHQWSLPAGALARHDAKGEMNFGIELTTADGRRFTSQAMPGAAAEIVSNGPVQSAVHYHGELVAANGAASGVYYDCRISAFANSDHLLIEFTYEQRHRDSVSLPVRSVGLILPADIYGKTRGGVASIGEYGSPDFHTVPVTGGALPQIGVTALHQYYGSGRYDTVIDVDGETKRYDGLRPSGAFIFPSIAVGVADFDAMNPAALYWDPSRLIFYAQPPRHATYVDLPFGISQSFRLVVGPPQAEPNRLLAQASQPLRVFPDPAHTAQTGVFGKFMPSVQMREAYPLYETELSAFFDTFSRSIRRQDTTGGFDYGDAGSPGGWKNNETSLISSLIMQYLRSGNYAVWEQAVAMNRQFRDVAVLHAAPDSKWVQTHGIGVHTTKHFHIGHFWITGLIHHYLLTGDERSLQAAKGTAAELLSRARNAYTGRERARMLLHLAELYEITHSKAIKDAFYLQLGKKPPEDYIPYFIEAQYLVGLSIAALDKAANVFPDDPQLRKTLLEFGKDAVQKAAQQPLLSAVGEDRDHFVFEGMATLSALTDDPAYLLAVRDLLPMQMMNAHSMGANAVRSSAYLAECKRLGVPFSDLLTQRPFLLSLLSGLGGGVHDANLTLKLDDPASLRLYRLVSFRAKDKARDDALLYDLSREQGGRPLRHGTFAGEQFAVMDFDFNTIDSASGGGAYLLRITSLNDAQFDVAASAAGAALRADSWMYFRQGRHGNGFVTFDVQPAKGADEISVGLDWKAVAPGAVAVIELVDARGDRLGAARWGAPWGVDWDDEGKRMTAPDEMVIALPQQQGGDLRLEVEATKWLGWKVDSGLQSPWLGISPGNSKFGQP